jgi:thiol-disulfide isomerase/thioredoxin
VFLLALLLSLAAPLPSASASAAPTATASSAPSAQPKWDECVKSPVLPYDHPIGLKMRVLDGPDFDLVKYRGTAVLLNIFATWCGPCNHEMPALVRSAANYESRGLRVISIDVEEPDDKVRDFRKKYDITFPIAMDAHAGFAHALEVQLGSQDDVSFPVTLFIAPNGYLYCQKTGGMTDAELTYRIEHFLAESAPLLATPTP